MVYEAEIGITPAHAGNSPSFKGLPTSNWDHPRPCGEQSAQRSFRILVWGSPPPMRGTARQKGGMVVERGITPAHAGNSGKL